MMTFPIWWYTTFTEDNVCLEDFGLDNSTEFESSKQKWFSEGKEIPMNRSESPGKVQTID